MTTTSDLAARQFPQALKTASRRWSRWPRSTGKNENQEAIRYFDQAIARNEVLAEAHYYKASPLSPPHT
jgi:hypothetical protein